MRPISENDRKDGTLYVSGEMWRGQAVYMGALLVDRGGPPPKWLQSHSVRKGDHGFVTTLECRDRKVEIEGDSETFEAEIRPYIKGELLMPVRVGPGSCEDLAMIASFAMTWCLSEFTVAASMQGFPPCPCCDDLASELTCDGMAPEEA